LDFGVQLLPLQFLAWSISKKKGGVIGAFSLFPNGESLTHKTQPTLRLTAHFKDPDF